MNSKLRDEILNHLHIMGCQAMTQGHNDATSGKDIDLDWVEEFEENATDGLLALFERQLVEAQETCSGCGGAAVCSDCERDIARKARTK